METWAAGTAVGPYELLDCIGSGGMGEVWKARDVRLGRDVAIKRLLRSEGRFQHEARAIAALNHPHICQVYDVGADYLVMELIEGTPFEGPREPAEAVRLAIQVAEALEYAHRCGILHRDLKPANILVGASGAKLLDFGLAKEFTDTDATQTIEGTIAGTISYMSPEQAEGRTLDARSEVFSFGAVLYEAITGQRAFRSMAEVVRDDPPPAGAGALDAILERCLQKRSTLRYGSMAELRAALVAAVEKLGERRSSIAVLPFANMSPDPEQEYFSDGLAEEIINALARVEGLKVIARTSAFAFKGRNIDVREIAGTLGVSHVLEGSVRKAANRVRVTAQLIAARDGAHVWSERFDRELHDVFEVQDEIAAAIAKRLCGELLPVARPVRAHEPVLAAYEAYWKGIHHIGRADPENMMAAKACYEQATALDPGFALPYAGMAGFYLMASMSGVIPHQQGIQAALQAANRALEIAPDLAEAHALAGCIAAINLEWPEAERHFAAARSRTPVPPYVRFQYGLRYLHPMRRLQEAMAEMDGALREDPLNIPARMNRAIILWEMGRDDEASGQVQEMLARGPNPVLLALRVADLESRSDWAGALAVAEQWYRMTPNSGSAMGVLAGLLRGAGEHTRAQELLAQLEQGRFSSRALGFANYFVVTNDLEQAAKWVGEAIAEREPTLLGWAGLPPLRRLRRSHYWPALRAQMNLPPEPAPLWE